MTYLIGIVAFVVGAVIFFPLGINYRKRVSEKEISSAEEEGSAAGGQGGDSQKPH